jgi:hypothetical protein
MRQRVALLALAFAAALPFAAASGPASATEPFAFAPPSHIKLNRIYRVDTLNGAMTACQYGATDGSIGVTICYPAGEGAGPQAPGLYDIVASHHVDDGGIFRVNRRTGEISVCYVLNAEKVVCTPSAVDAPLATGSVEAPKP